MSASKPRVEITTYADGSPAILIHVPGDVGGWPIEEIGGAAVLAAYAASLGYGSPPRRECPCVTAEKPLCGPDCWHFALGRPGVCLNCGGGKRGRRKPRTKFATPDHPRGVDP